MKDPFYYLSKTPITDEMFERQGWEKVNEMEDGEEFYFYVLPLPKDNPDPAAHCLVSSANDEYEDVGLDEGQFIVELGDYWGLGYCTIQEEVEQLYKVLTKKDIE
jgi:hypothetical protein